MIVVAANLARPQLLSKQGQVYNPQSAGMRA